MAHPEIARYTETNITPAILVNSSASIYGVPLTLFPSLTSSVLSLICRENTCTIWYKSTLIVVQVNCRRVGGNQFLYIFCSHIKRKIIFLKSCQKRGVLTFKYFSLSLSLSFFSCSCIKRLKDSGFFIPVAKNKCLHLSIYLFTPAFFAKWNGIRPFCFYQTARFELWSSRYWPRINVRFPRRVRSLMDVRVTRRYWKSVIGDSLRKVFGDKYSHLLT